MNKPFLLLASLLFLCFSLQVRAQQYSFDQKIALAGDGGYDYLSIDEVNNHLFVSHGTSFHVIDLATEKQVATIDGMQGVHGIAIVNEVNKGFISDGKGKAVVVVDLTTFKIIKTIALPEEDEDGIIYDAYSKKVFVFNGDSKNTCVIDINTLSLVKTIALDGAPEFAVANGKGLIYNNLEDKNSLKVIDTKTLEVKATYPLAPCGGPTGIAFDAANQRLFTGCRTNKGLSVVDAITGKVITTLPIGAGVDAVVYDAETKKIYVSNGDATLTIIQQKSADEYIVIQTLSTQYRAKTMALDKKTKKIYVSAPEFEPGTRKIKPGTFAVLVYKPA
ncbi:cytochrome cd1-nitrite reductase-like protein [Russula earlei]|uniref:Cytochrome cd1-nitrite reductase-like protein n=1 Tax=Russula earlei TaxID=71964 RepID=A0ACC0TY71_9AGAM|nr:cytochrome cd1-nitrite reductase-like protein [Russula earlei]